MSRSARYPALSGAVFTVLMVLGAALFPMPPGGDVSPAAQPAWLAAHASAVIVQTYARAAAALAFIAFAAVLATACRQALSRASTLPALALAGGSLCGVALLLGQAVSLAAALYARDGGAATTVRALGAAQDGLLDVSALPALLLFLAVGLIGLFYFLAWTLLTSVRLALAGGTGVAPAPQAEAATLS